MNLGIRGHDIAKHDLEELVLEIEKKELTSVQLALSLSLPFDAELSTLTLEQAKHIGQTFQDHNIQIAVLSCYINMIHPNLNERSRVLERFKKYIQFAKAFGNPVVGTETGNVNEEIKFTVENFKEKPFQEVVESVTELVKEAEKYDVIVGIEGGVNHPIYSPKLMRRLIDEINSPNMQVIFDPVNYLTIDNYQNQDEIFHEAFELFGDRIVIVHAKDFVVNGKGLQTVPVGKGLLNYDTVMKLIKSKNSLINILMEETKEPYINEGMEHLKQKFQQA